MTQHGPIQVIPRMTPRFHKTLRNPTVLGGEVDMWEMADNDGETILSVAVASGCDGTKSLPKFMAMACNTHDDLVAALKCALDHIQHMGNWIGKQKRGYSFEALGEDEPGMRAVLAIAEGRAA